VSKIRPTVEEDDVDAWYCEWCDEYGPGHEMPEWERRGHCPNCNAIVDVFVTATLAEAVTT